MKSILQHVLKSTKTAQNQFQKQGQPEGIHHPILAQPSYTNNVPIIRPLPSSMRMTITTEDRRCGSGSVGDKKKVWKMSPTMPFERELVTPRRGVWGIDSTNVPLRARL